MYNDNLLINSTESEREILFNYICNGLLNYYSKESIVKKSYKLSFISKRFINDAISYDDICYFLIKKYYISNQPTNVINKELNMYIEQLSFENAYQLLINNPEVRQKAFNVYFDNLNKSNAILSKEKAYTNGYTKTNMTLSALDNYYLSKKINNNIKQNKVLKKRSITR